MAFPQDALNVVVELSLNGVWTNITNKVLVRDGINITRGVPDEGSQADPARAEMSINNAGGLFSPRNPTGTYYGLIGRNTPLRITVEGSVRFVGEVSAWPTRWDVTGNDTWVPIVAQGVLRRLGQGASPLRSAMYRGLLNASLAAPIAYWPAEDAKGSTSLASAVGGQPMKISGSPTLAEYAEFTSSDPVPLLANSEWSGTVPTYTPTGAIQVRFLLAVPSGGTVNGQTILRLRTTGSARLWHLNYGTGGTLQLQAFSESGGVLDTGAIGFAVNGKKLRVSVELQQSGSNIAWNMLTLEPGAASGVTWSGTLTSQTIGAASRVIISPDGGINDVAVGHVSVQSAITSLFDLGPQLAAFDGETAGRRIERLCAEEGVPFTSEGDLDDTTAMGPQKPATLMDLLAEAAEADMGLLYEPRAALGLAYRTRESLQNQTATLTLDYAAGQLAPPLEPVDDDQHVRNDITVTRNDGSSARVTQETGPLSVDSPPDGVGRYDDQVTLNLWSDAQLGDQASWRLHLGTVDETRFPQITIDQASAQIAGNATVRTNVRTLDVGDVVTITNLPAWIPPGGVSQIARGFAETLSPYGWLVEVGAVPASPWTVGLYNTTGRYGTAGSQLNSSANSSATSLSVATTLGPIWTTTAADFPFDIVVGGERMTVTNITGASSPQTFTVTRSVNGVVKAHSAGAAVALFTPTIRAL